MRRRRVGALDAKTLDDASVAVDDERLRLLRALAERPVAQAGVHADGYRLSGERACEPDPVVSLTILAELVSRFHEEAARSSERLDGLDAAVVWAGQHTCDLERC